jgi:hypothetical protein
MIDLLYAVGSCTDTVGAWEVGGQPDGLVVRVRTRGTYDSEPAAIEAAHTMVKGVHPGGYETTSVSVASRVEGSAGDRWRGIAEVVVARPD